MNAAITDPDYPEEALPPLHVSHKPQMLAPHFEGTARALLESLPNRAGMSQAERDRAPERRRLVQKGTAAALAVRPRLLGCCGGECAAAVRLSSRYRPGALG